MIITPLPTIINTIDKYGAIVGWNIAAAVELQPHGFALRSRLIWALGSIFKLDFIFVVVEKRSQKLAAAIELSLPLESILSCIYIPSSTQYENPRSPIPLFPLQILCLEQFQASTFDNSCVSF